MGLKERVQDCLGSEIIEIVEYRKDLTVEVPKDKIVNILTKLKEAEGLKFDFLSDIIGVDNSALWEKKRADKKKKKAKEEGNEQNEQEEKELGPAPPRFEVIYSLLSLDSNERLRVKIRVSEEDPVVDSITKIWKGANWPEREIYDMFGIRFKGHPNLKRLLMWEGFTDHPLRKDYPLEGKGEERTFDECKYF